VAGDDSIKRGAIEALIDAVRRFANGGRHVPEEKVSSGAFKVDHIDAEYVRALTTFTVAYLAKRLHSRRTST
jgi:hypothetical protein